MIQAQAIVMKCSPNRAQADFMRRFGGATRWVWNHMLAANKARYADEKQFIFHSEMQGMLPALKKEPGLQWLCDAPAGSLQRMTHDLDAALKTAFGLVTASRGSSPIATTPTASTSRTRNSRWSGTECHCPSSGTVRFRSGRLPAGKTLAQWSGRMVLAGSCRSIR